MNKIKFDETVIFDIIDEINKNPNVFKKIMSNLFPGCSEYLLSPVDPNSYINKNTSITAEYLNNKFKNLGSFAKTMKAITNISECINDKTIFGKVVIWKIEKGGAVLPHRDVYDYHKLVYRYVINVNITTDSTIRVDNNRIICDPGDIFLLEHDQLHEFVNGQGSDMYFIVFDIYKD